MNRENNSAKGCNVKTQYKKTSKAGQVWYYFRKNRGAMAGLFIIIIITFIALTADLWIDQELVVGTHVSERLQHPSMAHFFGTDSMGRDFFWRCIYATRYSLAIGVISTLISAAIGIPLGAVAGYFGGLAETLIMRLSDILSALPGILTAIVIVSAFGTGTGVLIFAVGVSGVVGFVRITRASILTIKNNEFVEAERSLGRSHLYIIFSHILPNCFSPILVQATLRVASAIIGAAALSFLGLGIMPPTPEWGALLNDGRAYIHGYSYLTVFPGLFIMITVLAFNLVGDGLRDATDPKLHD